MSVFEKLSTVFVLCYLFPTRFGHSNLQNNLGLHRSSPKKFFFGKNMLRLPGHKPFKQTAPNTNTLIFSSGESYSSMQSIGLNFRLDAGFNFCFCRQLAYLSNWIRNNSNCLTWCIQCFPFIWLIKGLNVTQVKHSKKQWNSTSNLYIKNAILLCISSLMHMKFECVNKPKLLHVRVQKHVKWECYGI